MFRMLPQFSLSLSFHLHCIVCHSFTRLAVLLSILITPLKREEERKEEDTSHPFVSKWLEMDCTLVRRKQTNDESWGESVSVDANGSHTSIRFHSKLESEGELKVSKLGCPSESVGFHWQKQEETGSERRCQNTLYRDTRDEGSWSASKVIFSIHAWSFTRDERHVLFSPEF